MVIMNKDTEQEKSNRGKYLEMFILYLNECFEAFIAIVIIRVAIDKGFDFTKIIQASLLIGFLTFLLEYYNKDLKGNIKQGITFTAGSQIINTFV
jgi:hypothetical protein